MQLSILVTIGVCTAMCAHAGDDRLGTADPFAEYQAATDRQLSTLLQNKGMPLGQTAANKQSDVRSLLPADFARKGAIFGEPFRAVRHDDFALALEHLNPMRRTLETMLERAGVPKELVAVVLVESGGRQFALSRRQARGLWQLIPGTARQYGLEVGADRDDRVQIERATRAAGWYLRDLYLRFENWPLALAAYNAGPDAVQRALERSGATTFWQLSANGQLPGETRNYVPAVLAAMRLLSSSASVQTNIPRRSEATWIYAVSATTE